MNAGDPIAGALDALVLAGTLAGAATIVWRDGEIVQRACVGSRDKEAGLPIERDSLFRIASMTKPVTSTAALMLLEEGRFALTDPIARWAPEFRNMRVLRSPAGPLGETDPADRPITFEDLLTHRAGLTYGAVHQGPIAKAYADALGGDIDSDVAPDDWIMVERDQFNQGIGFGVYGAITEFQALAADRPRGIETRMTGA